MKAAVINRARQHVSNAVARAEAAHDDLSAAAAGDEGAAQASVVSARRLVEEARDELRAALALLGE